MVGKSNYWGISHHYGLIHHPESNYNSPVCLQSMTHWPVASLITSVPSDAKKSICIFGVSESVVARVWRMCAVLGKPLISYNSMFSQLPGAQNFFQNGLRTLFLSLSWSTSNRYGTSKRMDPILNQRFLKLVFQTQGVRKPKKDKSRASRPRSVEHLKFDPERSPGTWLDPHPHLLIEGSFQITPHRPR